jgi:large subunit ribosomal protein L9
LATESAKKVLAENLRQRAHKEAQAITDAKATAEKLAGVELKMTAKVGTGNKLFGAVTNQNVADELAKAGVTLEKKFIQIVGGSIKALGHYTAAVRLHREVVVNFEFDVVAEA